MSDLIGINLVMQRASQKLARQMRGGAPKLPKRVPKRPDQAVICQPNCPVCGGVGRVRADLPIDHPRFGRLFPCPEIDRAQLLGSWAGLEGLERDLGWGDIVQVNGVERAIEAVKKTIRRGWGWVYLWGGYGQGKTLVLKVAVALWLREHGKAAYVRMADIIEDLRAAYDTQHPSRESASRLAKWAGVPLLAIDEVDRLRETEYAQEKRFVMLDRRYEKALRRQSITIMAANQGPGSLPGYLYDRVRTGAFEIVQLEGGSFRPAMDEAYLQMAFDRGRDDR